MPYTLLKDVFLDGEVKSAGDVVDIEDADLAKSLLEQGSVEATDKAAAVSTNPLPVSPSPVLKNEGKEPTIADIEATLKASETALPDLNNN